MPSNLTTDHNDRNSHLSTNDDSGAAFGIGLGLLGSMSDDDDSDDDTDLPQSSSRAQQTVSTVSTAAPAKSPSKNEEADGGKNRALFAAALAHNATPPPLSPLDLKGDFPSSRPSYDSPPRNRPTLPHPPNPAFNPANPNLGPPFAGNYPPPRSPQQRQVFPPPHHPNHPHPHPPHGYPGGPPPQGPPPPMRLPPLPGPQGLQGQGRPFPPPHHQGGPPPQRRNIPPPIHTAPPPQPHLHAPTPRTPTVPMPAFISSSPNLHPNNALPHPHSPAPGYTIFQLPQTPHPLPPSTPITPLFAAPPPYNPSSATNGGSSSNSSLNVKFAEDAKKGGTNDEKFIPILRDAREETLLPRSSGESQVPLNGNGNGVGVGARRKKAGDDFWRRFSMVAKQESERRKSSAWLHKTRTGSSRFSTLIWIIGLVLLAAIGLGVGLAVYVTRNNAGHQIPKTVGGNDGQGIDGKHMSDGSVMSGGGGGGNGNGNGGGGTTSLALMTFPPKTAKSTQTAGGAGAGGVRRRAVAGYSFEEFIPRTPGPAPTPALHPNISGIQHRRKRYHARRSSFLDN